MGTQRVNGSLYTSIENGIATVTFGHPASNAFVSELLVRLAKEFHKLSELPNVVVIVLKSEGDRAFCAGASFDELVALSNIEEGKAFFSGFANVINAMRRCKKIVVTRVQGKAVGGGVGLIAASDYAFATDHAAIRLSEIAIGIAPLVISPAVERKIGKSGFAELSMAPETWKNAYWAKEKGLFAQVFERTSEMDKELHFFTKKLASYNPDGLASLKKILWEGTEEWDNLLLHRAQMSGELALSSNTKEALAKFKK